MHLPLACLLLMAVTQVSSQQQRLSLWYKQPAVKWTEALPVGNGRMGAMIFGGVQQEHLQFNEATLWTGEPRRYDHPGAAEYLQPIRQLLAGGKQKEAEALADAHFMGKKSVDDSSYKQQQLQWLNKVKADTRMASPSWDDASWKTMQLPLVNGWETAGLEGIDGALWFRTTFVLPAQWKGKNMIIALGRIRDVDFSYINGKLIGSSEGISNKRVYTIPAGHLVEGKNTLAVQVINFYDKGGFTGVKSKQPFFVVYPEGTDPEKGIVLSDTWKYAVQDEQPPAYPQYQASFQPFGDVWFNYKHGDKFTAYKRELSLDDALSAVTYTSGSTKYRREYFASAPHGLIAMRMSASQPGSVSLEASFSSDHTGYIVKQINANTIALQVAVKNGVLKGVAYLSVKAQKGLVTVKNNKIEVKGANEAVFYLVAATSFKNYRDVTADPFIACNRTMKAVSGLTYDVIKAKHLADYRTYFRNFSIELGAQSALPTDERIKRFNATNDPGLLSLYMQYGRYLLLSSSRAGGQPANLQGLWNDLLTPPWGSKYTTNINLEMNYWPADLLGLSDCTAPLFDFIGDLQHTGSQTARTHYDAPGWVLHHNTDLWRATAPINSSTHGIWVTGAAWLCHHMWDHYLFTQDTTFLKKYYPVMKEAATFFTSFLVKDPVTGWLISTPSNSPEQGGLVAGPSMDHQIIRDLLKNSIEAARALKLDTATCGLWRSVYMQLAPNQVGKYGQLQEWLQDIDDTTNTHRHVSHLWGVYPGTDITSQTPSFMQAARKSLYYRGDEGTGWSLAWKVNLWARLRDGDHALKILCNLLTPAENGSGAESGGVYSNLFDAHPPFQIDGNFGGAAGLGEMLLQSHENNTINILPALPRALASGSVKGLRARGGFTVDFEWRNGRLTKLTLYSTAGNTVWLQYGEKRVLVPGVKGKIYHFNAALSVI